MKRRARYLAHLKSTFCIGWILLYTYDSEQIIITTNSWTKKGSLWDYQGSTTFASFGINLYKFNFPNLYWLLNLYGLIFYFSIKRREKNQNTTSSTFSLISMIKRTQIYIYQTPNIYYFYISINFTYLKLRIRMVFLRLN